MELKADLLLFRRAAGKSKANRIRYCYQIILKFIKGKIMKKIIISSLLPVMSLIAMPSFADPCTVSSGTLVVASPVLKGPEGTTVSSVVPNTTPPSTGFVLLIPTNVAPKFSGGTNSIEPGYTVKFTIQTDAQNNLIGDTTTGCVAETVEVRPTDTRINKSGSKLRGGDSRG